MHAVLPGLGNHDLAIAPSASSLPMNATAAWIPTSWPAAMPSTRPARDQYPEPWSGNTRNLQPVEVVTLNPVREGVNDAGENN